MEAEKRSRKVSLGLASGVEGSMCARRGLLVDNVGLPNGNRR